MQVSKDSNNAPEPIDVENPIAVASTIAKKAEKPDNLNTSAEKNKESLEPAELFWGGYKGTYIFAA